MNKEINKEREDFVKEREAKYGAKIDYMVFARYRGTASSGNLLNISGLLYVINKNIYYEDFKPKPSIVFTNNDKNYTKFTLSILNKDIKDYKLISQKSLSRCIHGNYDDSDLKLSTNPLIKIFTNTITMIQDNNNIHIFDIVNNEDFIKKYTKLLKS